MSSLNKKTVAPVPTTAEGSAAIRESHLQKLIRTVMSCMLWEDGYYEDGMTTAQRIKVLVHSVPLEAAAGVAFEARSKMHLRHVPLLIAREMARHPLLRENPRVVGDTIAAVIQRPDELSEFLSIYWKDGKTPLSKQVKLGLAAAFNKFSRYSLAKYNRDRDIKLRDVLHLVHAKPADVTDDRHWTKEDRQALLSDCEKPELYEATGHRLGFTDGELKFRELVEGNLPSPKTWEERLSAGENKKKVFEELMAANELGDLAFLRNLSNMLKNKVERQTIIDYGANRKWERTLPFRFLSAAKVVPEFEAHIEQWMFKCLEGSAKLGGKTALIVDTSPSMWQAQISSKSDLSRFDAAAALAILIREVCDDVAIYAFNEKSYSVKPRRGMALRDELLKTRGNASAGGLAVKAAMRDGYDRIIVLTDGQWHPDDGERVIINRANPHMTKMRSAKECLPAPVVPRSYLIDVSGNENSIGHEDWLCVFGFSEAIVDYIQMHEAYFLG